MKESGALKSNILLAVSFVLIVVTLYLIFMFVPTERTMGIVQRIFYLHVPVAWVAFVSFFHVFLGSVLYLWKRNVKWDLLAHAATEIGLIFTTLILITGPLWAKPAWGTWWTWDPRLTTSLIMWLMYLACLMVRSFAEERTRGARFAAVVGIVGFIDVPITALAITLWRTQHPAPVIFSGGLAPKMLLTLIISVVTFSFFFFLLLRQAISIKKAENEIQDLKEEY